MGELVDDLLEQVSAANEVAQVFLGDLVGVSGEAVVVNEATDGFDAPVQVEGGVEERVGEGLRRGVLGWGRV